MDHEITRLASEQASRVLDEMTQLVNISTPSGELTGTEAVLALCQSFLPEQACHERVPCSTDICAPDLISVIPGTGAGKVLLLGHVDTVIPHERHQPVRRESDRLYGSGTLDMKGGVAISLAVARLLAQRPDNFEEVTVLLVCDEEWRTAAFSHVERFAGYDACLCFEAGERTADGDHAVIVTRKGAGTLRIYAHGVAAHSGAAPWDGRNALLALAHAAITVEQQNDPHGEHHLTVVPTVVRSGDAFNVVPAHGELIFDIRASDTQAFLGVVGAVPRAVDGVTLETVMERVWPAMDSRASAEPVLATAAELLGSPIVGSARGGASDASHFAGEIAQTIDGLGPVGGGAHAIEEHVLAESLGERTAVALALALAALAGR